MMKPSEQRAVAFVIPAKPTSRQAVAKVPIQLAENAFRRSKFITSTQLTTANELDAMMKKIVLTSARQLYPG